MVNILFWGDYLSLLQGSIHVYTQEKCLIGVGRGEGQGAAPLPPIIWEGGQHTLCPLIIHPHILQFLCEMWKNHNCTKLKGKIIINVTLIWFEGTGKTIPFNSILECSILSEFKMRNVIIWHWFNKNLVDRWRRNDVDATSLRRIDVSTTSCAWWEFVPLDHTPPPPPRYSKPSYAYGSHLFSILISDSVTV